MSSIPITICNQHFVIKVHDEDEVLSNIIRNTKIYSQNDLVIFDQLLDIGDHFIDLGSNIGWHTLFASTLVGNSGKVFSFEPVEKNFEILLSNIALNNYQNIIPVNTAVLNYVGQTEMYCSPTNYGDNITTSTNLESTYDKTKNVTCTTLDYFIETNPTILLNKIKLIKMDIQGSESRALKGMATLIKAHHPPIILEYSPVHLKMCGDSPFDILSFIDQHNYIPFHIQENRQLSHDQILSKVDFPTLVELTGRLLHTPGYGVDLLLLQRHAKPLLLT